MANLTTHVWQLWSGTWCPNPRFLRIKEYQMKTNAPSPKLRPSSTKCNCRDFFYRIVTVTFWLHLLSRLFFFHEMMRKIGWRLEMSTNVATKAQRPSHFHHFFKQIRGPIMAHPIEHGQSEETHASYEHCPLNHDVSPQPLSNRLKIYCFCLVLSSWKMSKNKRLIVDKCMRWWQMFSNGHKLAATSSVSSAEALSSAARPVFIKPLGYKTISLFPTILAKRLGLLFFHASLGAAICLLGIWGGHPNPGQK